MAVLCWLGCSGPASAAKIEGFGSISGQGQIDTAYEDPNVLNVAKVVELTASDLGHSGYKLLLYSAEGQYGRIGVRSHIGGEVPQNPDLSTSVDIGLSFLDLITPHNLNPLGQNFLRLDVDLSGEMTGMGATSNGTAIGHLTTARFGMSIQDPQSSTRKSLSFIEFAWFGPHRFITNEAEPGSPPLFVAAANEQPSFAQNTTPGPPRYFFGTRGFIDVPLNAFGNLGSPFLLEVSASAHSSCSNEIPECLAVTDFGSTALIGNGRIVDQNGALVAGAAFSSESGYDYITPPPSLNGVAPIPEPQTWALMLAGFGVLGVLRRRLNRPR